MNHRGILAICLLLALLTALAVPAHAHDPLESTAVARLQHERLELVVTMPVQLASGLVAPPGDIEGVILDASNFAQYRGRLEKSAAELYQVTADQTVLTPLRASVALKDGHVEFVIIYPQPASAPLRFTARYLNENQPSAAYGTLTVFNADEKPLGNKLLLAQNAAAAELSLASLSESQPEPTPAPAEAQKPATSTPAKTWISSSLAITLSLFALAAVSAIMFLRKFRKEKVR